ncbi:MAG TPA: hypothetical protein VF721_22740 [Pyrinomonadaceae bacterium]|jgi:hypothetical protein
MLILNNKAKFVCRHETGRVTNKPSQDFVKIEKEPILVEIDPEGRTISGCPVAPPIGRPCVTTLVAFPPSYSEWIRVGGKRVTLDRATGFTDGTPPGTVLYKVNFAGQEFVSEKQK